IAAAAERQFYTDDVTIEELKRRRASYLLQDLAVPFGLFLRHTARDLHQHVVLDVDVGREQVSESLVVFAHLLEVLLRLEREDASPGTLALGRYREGYLLLVGLRDEAAIPFAVYLLRLANLEPLVAEGLYHLLGIWLAVYHGQQQHYS